MLSPLPGGGASVPAMSEDLTDLAGRIAACRLCEAEFSATATAHRPRPVLRAAPTARLLIAGQAPGMRVHQTGLPFNDPSGDRLRNWLGIDRETFYDARRIAVVPMAFCFPGYDATGSDLAPPRRCAATWRAAVLATLPRVELTLAIGQHAQAWHLPGPRRSVTEAVADWRAGLPAVLALPHPSWRNTGWLRRNPWFAAEVLPWLRAQVARLLE